MTAPDRPQGLEPPSTADAAAAPSRRDVLRSLAYGAAGVAAAGALASCSSDPPPTPAAERTTTTPAGGGKDDRLLIVVEMSGGNDGLSTLVPWEDPTYHDLRPTLALDGDQVIDWGGGWGINAGLREFHERKVAMVAGVGAMDPDLSHFEMLDRWWHGLPAGRRPDDRGQPMPGFLGRLADQVHGDERFTAVSTYLGNSPILRAAQAATTSMPDNPAPRVDNDDAVHRALLDVIDRFSANPGPSPVGQARAGMANLLDMVDLLGQLAPPTATYPESQIGSQMELASRLLRSDAGIRIVHLQYPLAVYDTHQRHGDLYPPLIEDLNASVAALLGDLDRAGLGERVLLATISEFGRRPAENADGLDHGTASTVMLLGDVEPGIHGEPSSITSLDPDGNLVATVDFDRYLAILAEWMQVDPADVLGDGGKAPTPLPGVLRS